MRKADAAAFIEQLAQAAPLEADKPRVILVRANRQLKLFVAKGLESIEEGSQSLDNAVDSDTAQELLERFQTLSAESHALGLHKLGDTLCYAETLAGLVTVAVGRSADTPAEHRWASVFSVILRNLSAALLRVYVEGTDDNCDPELMMIRRLVYETSPKPGLSVAHAGATPVFN